MEKNKNFFRIISLIIVFLGAFFIFQLKVERSFPEKMTKECVHIVTFNDESEQTNINHYTKDGVRISAANMMSSHFDPTTQPFFTIDDSYDGIKCERGQCLFHPETLTETQGIVIYLPALENIKEFSASVCNREVIDFQRWFVEIDVDTYEGREMLIEKEPGASCGVLFVPLWDETSTIGLWSHDRTDAWAIDELRIVTEC